MKGLKWCPTGPEAIAVWVTQTSSHAGGAARSGGGGEEAGVMLDLGVTEDTQFNYAFKQITIGGLR